MLVVEWEGLSFGASAAKHKIMQYLEDESEAADMILVEAYLDELLGNISRCAPSKATLEITWREDGAALIEVSDIVPTVDPVGVAQTEGWGLMLTSALNGALDVVPSRDGNGDCVTAVLPVVRKTQASA
ncbi:MAG: hypothetical protein ABSE64_09090 [Vulcanimicrobiaceae bacterium]|jgi:hypothetical protein